MKPGPIIAMIVLVFLGMWLVLQPALSRSDTDLTVSVGAIEIMLNRTQTDGNLLYEVVAPANLRTGDLLNSTQLDALISVRLTLGSELESAGLRVPADIGVAVLDRPPGDKSILSGIGQNTEAIGSAPINLDMAACLSCHADEGANEDCTACHR